MEYTSCKSCSFIINRSLVGCTLGDARDENYDKCSDAGLNADKPHSVLFLKVENLFLTFISNILFCAMSVLCTGQNGKRNTNSDGTTSADIKYNFDKLLSPSPLSNNFVPIG